MPETLSAADFEQRIQEVSERLEALKGAPRAFGSVSTGLPYAGVDLTPELPHLAPILQTLLHQDPDDPVTRNPRLEVGARRLALAAMQGLVTGGEGRADVPARYEEVMGAAPEYALFDRVLPLAMREAGILPTGKADAKRLLEALLAEAGMPASLVLAATEYFVTYWRWFHPLPDVLTPLHRIAAGHEIPGLAADRVDKFKGLAGKLLPNAAVLGPVIEGLATVMAFLRTQPKWRVGDLFEQSEAIAEASGVSPKGLLLNNEEAFQLLADRLGHAWHPEQFRHVLTTLPRDGEVRMPNGSLSMAQKAVAIPYWGVYRIESKTYTVLPDEGLTFEEIKGMPAGARVVGNRVLWKGEEDVEISADAWPQVNTPRHLYEERQSEGWFYYNVPPVARTLQIGEKTLAPLPGIAWRTSLLATLDDEGKPHLNIRVAGLRVCLPALAGKTLQLESPQTETAGRLTFELDDRGVGGLPELLLPITHPTAGAVELFLHDHATGEVIEHEERRVSHRLQLPEIILASEATGQPIPPSTREFPHGLPSYLVFAARPVNTGALQMLDIGVDALAKTGDYETYRLRWADPSQPLVINLGAQFTWNFDIRLETIWQAGDLPAPQAPLVFAPETPIGYTVSSADHLYVDDISMVPQPLLVIYKEEEVLAAHTWHELNWMMNYPEDNRRFSGPMLRRALHVGADFDLAGRYQLVLKDGGQILGSRQVLILPELKLDVKPSGPQLEETQYTLVASSAHPCFEGLEKRLKVELGSPVVDRDVMENTPFQPKPVEATLKLLMPLFDLHVAITPDVVGFRLLDENEGTCVRKTMLSHEELDHITLVLFGTHAKKGSLRIGEDELVEEFYEGFATFSLAEIQSSLTGHESEVEVKVDGRSVGTLTVTWHPRVHHLDVVNEYLIDHAAHLEIEATGPADTPLVLKAFTPDGREIGQTEFQPTAGDRQEIHFDLPASRDYPVITIRAFVPTEATGVSYDPEIEALNKRIAEDQRSGELRYERAQLLLARGLRKAAARDFQAAVDLGMTELLESPQYQQFMSQRRAESFHEDIKALASFFVPFARKELTIG